MKAYAHACAWLCVCCWLAAVGAASAAPYKGQGYQITPPAGWTTITGAMGSNVAFVCAPQHGFADNINLVITSAPANGVPPAKLLPQISVYATHLLSHQFTHYALLARRPLTVAGDPAYQTTATYQMGTPPSAVEARQVYVLHDGHCYIFTLTALTQTFARKVPAFTAALNTLHWIK